MFHDNLLLLEFGVLWNPQILLFFDAIIAFNAVFEVWRHTERPCIFCGFEQSLFSLHWQCLGVSKCCFCIWFSFSKLHFVNSFCVLNPKLLFVFVACGTRQPLAYSFISFLCRMASAGHLFLVKGDVRLIANDAWLCPINQFLVVEQSWAVGLQSIPTGVCCVLCAVLWASVVYPGSVCLSLCLRL